MTVGRLRMLLVVAVLLVFGRLLWCDFTWWDDWFNVHDNSMMRQVRWDTFTFYWTTPTASIYVPLTQTVWGLVSMVAQVPPDDAGVTLNATLYHGTNLLIHAGGALAAFALLRRLVKHDVAAFLGALLWAVHPVQVESVGWVSGLKDVLSGTLVLCSLLLFVRARQDGKRGAMIASVVVYALAMLAKPSAFTMPLLLVVIDRLVLGTAWKKIAVTLVPYAILTVPIALIAKAAQPAVGTYSPLWVRPFVAADSLAFYAVKIVAPVHLAIDYGRNVQALMSGRTLFVSWLLPTLIAGVTVWAYARARRSGRTLSPLPAVGLLIFALAPLHVLGLAKSDFQVISVVADHYLYVSVFGAAVLLAWAVVQWPKLVVPAAVLVTAAGVRAALQTPVWQNESTLMANTLAVNPRSFTAYINLSVEAGRLKRHDEERALMRKAEEISPEDTTMLIGMIVNALADHDIDKADDYSRRLINVYNRYWLPANHLTSGPYTKIIGYFFDSGALDYAEKYLNEAKTLAPNDPDLARFAERIRWKRQAEREKAAATRPATRPN